MTFTELLDTLQNRDALRPSRAKDVKTSLRYLAEALGYDRVEACPVGDACREEARWGAALDAHFQARQAQGRGLSLATERNTRNNIRVAFRLADAHGLLAEPLPLPLPVPLRPKPLRSVVEAEARTTAPYQTTYRPTGPRHYGLPIAQWPPEILEGWAAYQEACGVRLRDTSFKTYEKSMATYLGYLIGIQGRTVAWDDLFHVRTVREFLRWHNARLQRATSSISVHGRSVVIMLAAIAVVLERPERRTLADFRNGLPAVKELHKKEHHAVPLATLDAVADACLAEGRAPYQTTTRIGTPGLYRACAFQKGLMLKLLVRVPLRQRNIREMRLGQNLYEDEAGHWQLHFEGDELKIGDRKGRGANVFHVDLTEYCPEWLPLLHEFRRDFRPRFPQAATQPTLFVTIRGNPFTQRSLQGELGSTVLRQTGKRFYVHLIRSIWATEYLSNTHESDAFATCAEMLGDTIQTVTRTYYQPVREVHHAKAKAFLTTALKRG